MIRTEVKVSLKTRMHQVSAGGIRGRGIFMCLWFVLFGAVLTPAFADTWIGDCGTFEEARAAFGGPFDYMDPRHRARHLPIVEQAHFTDDVFALRAAGHGGILGSDIHYTLNRFPNHHRALDAMSRLSIREGTLQPRRARYTIDCYFDRAIRWRPNDAMVRLVYSIHHHRYDRLDEAIEQARIGLALAPENPEILYNLGLFLVRAGEYAEAREHARKAYDLGYPLDGLRNQLRRAGHWTD